MGFVAICTAIYDYKPQSTGELEIDEGELLYILEKSLEDDWWKAKKKAAGDDEDEPEGLIPNNYVQDAKPTHTAKALYDYSRQTDEEVSFSEDAPLDVYDTSDPDWTLVGFNGDFGFAPANYIEISGAAPAPPSASSTRHSIPPAPIAQSPTSPASPIRTPSGPAADLARVLAGGPASPAASRAISSPPPSFPHQQPTPDASDGEEGPPPQLPRRPNSETMSPPAIHTSSYEEEAPGVLPSPPYNRAVPRSDNDDAPVRSPGGFHLYNINEMVSAMGRRRKMPTTLGINIATGIIMLSPEKSRDGPSQEWTADKMTHYSIEGKHVFIELVRPSKSLDLHAGAKDTAEEIVRALGEIAGLHRAEGIREVIAAASAPGTHKKGQVLYDFMAQGDDEVTVGVGDEVVVLDDTKSEEWWNVRRLKNGAEGVVPSSYVEITGLTAIEPPSRTGINAGKSAVDQNRLEEERLAREAARADRARQEAESARAARAEASAIPQRGSSLADETSHRRDRKERDDRKKGRSRPDSSKVRTWTDHSGTFKVEAQFLAVAEGKIHLHKVNGVKIAVPVTKMSPEDLAYVEQVTNESIEEHIPVADLIKMKRRSQASEQSKSRSGASVDPRAPDQSKSPEYDWFDFFLKAGVGPHQCERYSQAMIRDSMDESVLPDITTDTLRTLGLKEGDALKVMKYLDQRFGRSKGANANGTNGDPGFSLAGPNGVLQNNTRRGRPEATRQVSDVVDQEAFNKESEDKPHPEAKSTPLTQVPAREPQGGFDDDAWTVKPSKAAPAASQPAAAATPVAKPPTGAAIDLSLLDAPLQPTPAVQQQPTPQPPTPAPPAAPVLPQPTTSPAHVQQTQQIGANAQFFSQLNQQPQPQTTGVQLPQINASRQRPQAPQSNLTGVGLLPPPPRPTSAPQNPQQNQFGLQPLQPQLTGIPLTSALQAPPGQSLNDLNQQRLQQQYQQMSLQSQQTGFVPQPQALGQYGLVPHVTGYQPQPQLGQFQQPYINGNAAGSPFADPRSTFQPQPTGIPFQQSPPPGGINSVLPPALQPQRTGFTSPLQQSQTTGFQQPYQIQPSAPGIMQPQQTGFPQGLQPQQTSFGQPQANGYGDFQPPPVPPIPQMPTPAPLQPQKTGPAPLVKFGVTEGKKLTPQPTGRRANLANASKFFNLHQVYFEQC
ncbi:uncharacterized protein A1O9_01290 [Exophiala aquamarina CBS 119918]|uniref:Actin cytoskeleton-regulatory complex protein SLA1 n=1 Tax=Exophiala aquamarina CBS 119918 TaxID=1182545 RepID=A0A072PVG7_9EURO|nr:uncharacterized protein A1O9_01290 [Exophiala aquamarina CBS 119918]KEF63313.1 hypothetical protein A1O9_01290 [Exophiala aquamarina CBS 119918]